MIGPIVGGFVADSSLGWHFNFWLMLLLGAISLIMGYFLAPETVCLVINSGQLLIFLFLRRSTRRFSYEGVPNTSCNFRMERSLTNLNMT